MCYRKEGHYFKWSICKTPFWISLAAKMSPNCWHESNDYTEQWPSCLYNIEILDACEWRDETGRAVIEQLVGVGFVMERSLIVAYHWSLVGRDDLLLSLHHDCTAMSRWLALKFTIVRHFNGREFVLQSRLHWNLVLGEDSVIALVWGQFHRFGSILSVLV